jgi:DNA-binding XRE family transcriptional regulator
MSPALRGSPAASIADRIKEVRVSFGMTQEDFADLIEVTRSHLASIETYRIEPSLSAIIGVLCIDLRVAGEPTRPIDPTWLLLGPDFERDMFGKIRHGLREAMSADDLHLLSSRAQHGTPNAGA